MTIAPIDPDIVGIVTEVDAREFMTISSVKADRTVSAGDNQLTPVRQPGHPLRFGKAGDAPRNLARPEIDDIDRAIGNLGDEQPTIGEIDREMINPALGIGQRDLPLEHKRRARMIRPCHAAPRESDQQSSHHDSAGAHHRASVCRNGDVLQRRGEPAR